MQTYKTPRSLERWERNGERWVSQRTGKQLDRESMAHLLAQSGQRALVAYDDDWLFLPDGEDAGAPVPRDVQDTILPRPAQDFAVATVGTATSHRNSG